MNRTLAIQEIRAKLTAGCPTIGSWMQLGDGSVAEIMGAAGYDWVAVDLEHGSIGIGDLPDLFRALELGGTLPLARIRSGEPPECKSALDAGAGGVIVPMIESERQVRDAMVACRWPPAGRRGVGFSRANLFGGAFDTYSREAQSPLFVAMIESAKGVEQADAIFAVDGLDAILIGPYDLSASLGCTGCFDHPDFVAAVAQVRRCCERHRIPTGIHVVEPDSVRLRQCIREGHLFIPFSVDAVLLRHAASRPSVGAP